MQSTVSNLASVASELDFNIENASMWTIENDLSQKKRDEYKVNLLDSMTMEDLGFQQRVLHRFYLKNKTPITNNVT